MQAYVAMAYILIAYVVMAYIMLLTRRPCCPEFGKKCVRCLTADRIMAYIVMAYIFMAYIVMAPAAQSSAKSVCGATVPWPLERNEMLV